VFYTATLIFWEQLSWRILDGSASTRALNTD